MTNHPSDEAVRTIVCCDWCGELSTIWLEPDMLPPLSCSDEHLKKSRYAQHRASTIDRDKHCPHPEKAAWLLRSEAQRYATTARRKHNSSQVEYRCYCGWFHMTTHHHRPGHDTMPI